jgi:hypothetical protein
VEVLLLVSDQIEESADCTCPGESKLRSAVEHSYSLRADLLIDAEQGDLARLFDPFLPFPLMPNGFDVAVVAQGCDLGSWGAASPLVVQVAAIDARLIASEVAQDQWFRSCEDQGVDFVANLERKSFEVAGACHGRYGVGA